MQKTATSRWWKITCMSEVFNLWISVSWLEVFSFFMNFINLWYKWTNDIKPLFLFWSFSYLHNENFYTHMNWSVFWPCKINLCLKYVISQISLKYVSLLYWKNWVSLVSTLAVVVSPQSWDCFNDSHGYASMIQSHKNKSWGEGCTNHLIMLSDKMFL